MPRWRVSVGLKVATSLAAWTGGEGGLEGGELAGGGSSPEPGKTPPDSPWSSSSRFLNRRQRKKRTRRRRIRIPKPVRRIRINDGRGGTSSGRTGVGDGSVKVNS